MSITYVPGRSDLVEHPMPIPVSSSGPSVETTGSHVVCYAANPAKKGLDTMVLAWSLLGESGRRLLVAGIDRKVALRFLNRRGIDVPDSVDWLGSLPALEFRAIVRQAAVYLAASKYEDYGIAQLEAIADGTPLVTTPSRGPFEALGVIRQLAPELVAKTDSAEALSVSLRSALNWSDEKRALYQRDAAVRMADYSSLAMRRSLSEILPGLLSDGGVGAHPG